MVTPDAEEEGAQRSPAAAEVARSFATIREMLRDRVSAAADMSSLDAVRVEDVVAASETQNVFHIDLPSCRTRVVYNLHPKFKMPDVKKLLTGVVPGVPDDEQDRVQFVVVIRERPIQGKGVDELSRDVQLFLLKELQFNLTRHSLVPPHVPIRDEAEIDAVLHRYSLRSRNSLPLILANDPVARYYALKPGQLVRITRPSPSAGTYVLYRCCH